MKSIRFIVFSLVFFGLAAPAWANSNIIGTPVITALDATNPWCPGGLVQVSVTVQNLSNNGEDGRILIALSNATYTSWGSLPNSIQSNVWHFACDGCGVGSTGAPLQGSNNNNYPNGGYKAFSTAGPITKTVVFTLQLPSNLIYGGSYYFHIATNAYYLGVGAAPTQGTAMSPSFHFNACTPSGGSSFVGKRVEGTADIGEIMLYWLDYDYINSTNNQIQDTIPSCMTILAAQPQPYSGAPATIAGNTVTWRVADATSASTPVAYREKGALWVEVMLPAGAPGPCAGQVCNTAQYTSNYYGGAWQNSNQVCQNIGGVNVTLYKRQYDSSYTPISTAPDGATINYVLNYTLSGSGLRCFDSFNSYSPGTYPASALFGASWSKDPDSTGSDTWNINSLASGERYLQYNCNACGVYSTLRYSCPQAASNGEDICGNVMVESDVRIDGNAANGDTGLVIRTNGLSGKPGGGGRGYQIILSVDAAGGVANLQLQRNNDNWGAWTNAQHWPPAAGYITPAGQNPVQGVWYTIKALEQPAGTFRLKFWERGTPEPAWQVTYTDTNMAADGLACGNAGTAAGTGVGDGWVWKPGVAGQADLMSYDNFRVYGAASLTNASLWDTIPAGIDYTGTLNTPLASTPVGGKGTIAWSFNNNFGAVGNVLYEGSGSFTWMGKVNCTEAGSVQNVAAIGADPPASTQMSNTTNLSIDSCGTPTSTVTPSSTATPTSTLTSTPTASPTRTATPTVTPSATPSSTPSNTPTNSDTPTVTPSSTQSVTPSGTPTSSVTPTVTPSITVTTPFSPTPTYTATLTFSPSYTPSATQTATPTATETVTWSPSDTPSATPTATPSATVTNTLSPSDTPSATLTSTQSNTSTSTYTVSDTPSATASATATATPSATRTATQTVTITSTFTISPTITPTPVPAPDHLVIAIYNSAGELVRSLFNGSANLSSGAFNLSDGFVVSGTGGLLVEFPGYLMSPTQGQVNSLNWNTDNNGGQQVASGVYTVKVETTDPFGQVTAVVKQVQVLNAQLQEAVTIFNSAGEVVAKPVLPAGAQAVQLQSMSLVSNSYAPVFDAKSGQPSSVFRIQVTDSKGVVWNVDWNGLTGDGRPVSSGTYVAQLSVGNPGSVAVVSTRGFVVVEKGGLTNFDGAVAGPNPLVVGKELNVSYPVTLGLGASAELFDLAGEKVATADDLGQSGIIHFGTMNKLAPGVYILRLVKFSPTAVVCQRLLKVAVVH